MEDFFFFLAISRRNNKIKSFSCDGQRDDEKIAWHNTAWHAESTYNFCAEGIKEGKLVWDLGSQTD